MTESSATNPVPQNQAAPASGNGGAPAGDAPPLPPGTPQPADMAPAPIVYAPPGFWEQPWVQDVMPFVTSLTVHAAVIVIGLIVFGVYKSAVPTAQQDQIIIPEASLANETPPGGVPNEGAAENPLQAAQQDKDVNDAASAFADKKGPTADLTAGGGPGEDPSSVIAEGAAGGFNKGKGLLGANSGPGAGDSGAMGPFGALGGGGSGPKGPVFGNGGNAKKIVFVCDATGTMVPKMGALRINLSKTVNDLRASQQFDVIFFSDDRPYALSNWLKQPGVLVQANAPGKLSVNNFITTIVPRLEGGPLAAVELALKEKPDLIYILTDGEFPDSQKAVEIIHRLNKDHIKINTIAFINNDDIKHHVDVGFKKILKDIASDNGGTFNDVNPDEL
ncbi:MAG TPA: hypothetical protein VH370_07225 [Humisphaera sp.]|jgi:hypothetical protein|nr:hypothetical protein [Humisphaera sp.]